MRELLGCAALGMVVVWLVIVLWAYGEQRAEERRQNRRAHNLGRWLGFHGCFRTGTLRRVK